jgi:hypothetical protein
MAGLKNEHRTQTPPPPRAQRHATERREVEGAQLMTAPLRHRNAATGRAAAPRACAVRQGQSLELLSCEPCSCDAAQLQRCEAETRLNDFLQEMGVHAEQVERLHGAASDIMEHLDQWPRTPSPWIITETGRPVPVTRDRWRRWRFRTPHTWAMSEQDIGLAFGTMLYLADDLDSAHALQNPRHIIPVCDAPTLSARAYQAACQCLTAYYDLGCTGFKYIHPGVVGDDVGHFVKAAFGIEPMHRGFPEHDISAARIVAEVFQSQLVRHVRRGVPDYFIAMYTLDRSTDLRQSVSAAARILERDESSIRERYDRLLARIEEALGKYCRTHNELAQTPKSVSSGCYNLSIGRLQLGTRFAEPKLLPKPRPFALQDKVATAELQLLAWAQGHYRKQAGILPTRCPDGLARHYFAGAVKPDIVAAPEVPHFAIDRLRQYPAPPYGTDPLVIFNPMQPVHLGPDESGTQQDGHVSFLKQEGRGDLRLDPAKDFRWYGRPPLKRWYVDKSAPGPVIRNDVVELFETMPGDAPGAVVEDPEEATPFFDD